MTIPKNIYHTVNKLQKTEYKEKVIILNKVGIHARPAALLVQIATRFQSEIWIEKDGMRVNGKSIMGVMMLAAERGSELIFIAEGTDAEKAVKALVKEVENNFGE